jgi:hypothetical protein
MLTFDELVSFFLENALVRKIIAMLQLRADVWFDSVFVGQGERLEVLPRSSSRGPRIRQLPGCPLGCRSHLVEVQIQFQHIHAHFTQDAELPAFGMLSNHLPQFFWADPAFAADPQHLKLRRCGGDVGV